MMSAMPANMKRTVLTQEVVRIRRNMSKRLPWEATVKHLNDFSERLKLSGYDEDYRFQVIKSGVEGFDKMLIEEQTGGRPINRHRSWEEDQRQKKKELQKKNWFRTGGYDVPLFVPHTPRGALAKAISNERKRGPKQPGQEDKIQNRREGRSFFRKKAEKIKSLGRWQMWSAKVLPMQRRKRRQLLEGVRHLYPLV